MAGRNSAGRSGKLTPEVRDEICAGLEKGLFRRHAAALVGIDEMTLSRWYHRGMTEDRGRYRELREAIDKAEATFAQTGNELLRAGAVQNPKLAQWLLSRRFAELYGRKDNVEQVSPEDKAQQAAQLRDLLIERLEKFFPEPEPAPEPASADPAPEAPNAD